MEIIVESPPPRPEVAPILTSLRDSKAKAKDIVEAVDGLLQLEHVQNNDITVAMAALARKGMWEHAASLLNEMSSKDLQADVIVYNNLVTAFSKARRWRDTLELLEHMQDLRIKPGTITYSAAMTACADAAEWQVALDLLHGLGPRGLQADSIAFNAAIAACGAAGQWEQALEVFAGMPSGSIFEATMNALIRALGGSGEWQKALGLFRGLGDWQLAANAITYTVAIVACGAATRWATALALDVLDEAKKSGAKVNFITHGAVMGSIAVGGDWKSVLAVMEGMPVSDVKHDIVAFNTASGAVGEGSHWAAAWRLLQMARAKGLRLTEKSGGIGIGAMQSGGWQRASASLTHLAAAGLPVGVVATSAVLGACEKDVQWMTALDIVFQLPEETADVIAYNAALSTCEKALQWQRALELLFALKAGRLRSSIVSYSSATSACEKTGEEWQSALGVFETALVDGLETNLIIHSAIVSACEKSGQWSRALIAFAELERTRLDADLVACDAALSACKSGFCWATSLALLNDMTGRQLDKGFLAYSASLEACQGADKHMWVADVQRQLLLWMFETLYMPSRFAAISQHAAAHQARLSEDIGFAIDGLELLEWNGVVDALTLSSFKRNVYDALLPRLLLLQEAAGRSSFASQGGRLRDASLERQAGLGSAFTALALGIGRDAPQEVIESRTSWNYAGRLHVRRGLRATAAEATLQPSAQTLVASTSCACCSSPSPQQREVIVPGRLVGYGDAEFHNFLRPVFVEHDRAPHNERQALLSILASIDAALASSSGGRGTA
eukprot:TRINITY_DN4053_c0_g4_i1.p1 TRINITY_DN4053_c0_g4~~TRINITY_DN4053_c0_g4_i1.p1  ORF type:complete len:789 (+),score=165.02 TRINITY_DN4053_c0_g4_i1:204-2570(+)